MLFYQAGKTSLYGLFRQRDSEEQRVPKNAEIENVSLPHNKQSIHPHVKKNEPFSLF